MAGCLSLKPKSISILSFLVIAIVGLSLISVPAAGAGVGTWTTPFYPTDIAGQSCVVSGGYIYCIGGDASTSLIPDITNAVYFESLSSGVGVWTPTATYPTPIEDQSCVVSASYVYCVGGVTTNAGAPTSAVYFAELTPTGIPSSGVGSWTLTTAYDTTVYGQTCVASGGYIYCIGGSFTAVYFAKLSSSGVGTWKLTTNYPTTDQLGSQGCVVSGGYVYCVGGAQGSGGSYPLQAVYFAKLSSSGVGMWKMSTNTYPTIIDSQSCAAYEGYIYCIGGYNGATSSSVYFAKLPSVGVGAWKPTVSYPTPIEEQSCVVSGSYIYCVGGWTGSAYTNAVYFASV